MKDGEIMRRLVAEAVRAEGRTRTNPMVGAGLVDEGDILATAYHRGYGEPHAETALLEDLDVPPSGDTLFCTLEPCIHRGKTAPCVNKIAGYGFDRVVIGSPDPHPAVAGRGIEALRALGYSVEVGPGRGMYEWVNRAYFYGVETGFPWIDVKMATSADGYISPVSGNSRWITGEESRREGHGLRSKVDAVMVGANTLRLDDPRLTDRVTESDRQPEAIVVCRDLSALPAEARLFTERAQDTTILCPASTPVQQIENFQERGVNVVQSSVSDQQLNWNQLLPRLRRRGMGRILVEGGGQLIGSLLEGGHVNEFHHFLSGNIFGEGIPSVDLNQPPVEVEEASSFQLLEHRSRGDDVYVRRLAERPGHEKYREGFQLWNDLKHNMTDDETYLETRTQPSTGD